MSAIDQFHKDFARAVVALAREHHMDSISMSFRTSMHHPGGDRFGEQIQMNWSEGRHGTAGTISLECRAAETIKEKDHP